MAKVKNIVGERFGRLVIKEFNGFSLLGKSGNRTTSWLALCDCGNSKIVKRSELSGGLQSCGCLLTEFRKNKLPGITAKRNAKQDAGFAQVYSQYYYRAVKKNISFSLDRATFSDMIKSSCSYCGRKPSNVMKTKSNNFMWNGIDRLDNSIGYQNGNCVPCCTICNKARRDLTVNEFKQWIRDLTIFQMEKVK